MTIQQHASFDSSAAELNATSKLVKAWESKNAKNAAKAGGISMMALSLAACGGSSTTTTTTTTDTTDTTTSVTAVASNFTTAIDALSGTSAADTFTGDAATVSGADSVAGGAGSDTLKVYGIAASSLPTMSGVENLEVYNIANAGSFDLTAAAFADVTKLTLDNTTANAANTMTLEADDTLALKTVTGAADVNIATAATITTTSVEINGGVGASTDLMELDFNGTGLTSISLATTGANYVDIDTIGATAAVTLTVTGDGTGTLDVDDDQTTVDASATTGGMTIQGDFAANVAITAGSGDDTIVGAGEVSAKDVIDGGAGEDTLSVTADFTAATGTISNIEVIELAEVTESNITTATTVSQTIDVDDAFAGISKFAVSGHATDTTPSHAHTANFSINDAASGAEVTITVVDGDATANDNVTLDLKTDGTADTATFNIGSATVAADFDALTADDIETATMTVGSKDGHSILNLDLTDATAVTMSGSGNATIAGINLKDADNSFDASAATGDLTLTFEDAQDQTIKTGSGKDSVTLGANSLTDNDIIDMGDGTDTLNISGNAALDVTLSAANVETVSYAPSANNTGAIELDLREVSGLSAVKFDGGNTTSGDHLDATVTLTRVASGTEVHFININDDSNDTHTINASTGAAAIGVTLNDFDSTTNEDSITVNNASSLTLTNVTAASNVATLTTDDATSLSINASGGALTLDTLTTAKLTSIAVAGSTDVTISAGGATTIKTITAATLDAANNGAELVLGSTSALFARATDAVITGSDGSDTISMSVVSATHGSNVIKAGDNATVDGSATGDILVLSGSMTGDTIIDLSSTTDQISSLGGVANAAVQTGFESVDASGSTMVSTSKFTITGSSGINHITGDAGADIINSGDGADVLNQSAGADTYTFGAGVDHYNLGSLTMGTDTITDFAVGNTGDVIDINTAAAAATTDADGFGTMLIDGVGATTEIVDGFVIVDNGDTGTDNATGLTAAAIATYLGDIGGTTQVVKDAATATGYLAVSDGTDTAIIHYADGNADVTIDSGEITVLLVLSGIADAGTILTANIEGYAG